MGHLPVVHQPPGHRREHPAPIIAVPVAHAGVRPNELGMFVIHPAGVIVLDRRPDLQRRDALLDHFAQAQRDVPHLALGHEHHAAAMRQPGVGAHQREQIGVVRHRGAQMGTRVVHAPDLTQRHARTAANVHRREHLADLEAGGQDDHVRFVDRAVGRHQARAFDAIDRFGHQFDIGAPERLEPAVVDQDALAIGRIVREALGDQVVAAFELLEDVVGHHLAMTVVARIHRALGMRPVGVALQGGQQAVAEAPQQAEPVPGVVERHVLEQPLRLRTDAALVVGVVPCPLRRTLEDGDLGGLGRQRAHELHGAGAGADDRHFLAGQRHVVTPLRRVPGGSGEGLHARKGRHLGPVQLADRGDHRVGPAHAARPALLAQLDFPLLARLVPAQCFDLDPETDVATQLELVGELLQVFPDFGALGIVGGPMQIGGERKRVEMIGRVDTRLRIVVLEPGTAHIRILLDDGETDAHLPHPDGGAQARQSGADHEHLEVRQSLWRGRLPPAHRAVDEAHLLHCHRRIFGRNPLVQADPHHLERLRGFEWPGHRACAACQFVEHAAHCVAHRLLHVLGQATGRVGEQRDVPLGQVRRAQPPIVAREVGQTHQQSRH